MSDWRLCRCCYRPGYYSPKFKAVLCDRCYFEMNGKSLA